MIAIKRDNSALKEVLPKDSARPRAGQAASRPARARHRKRQRREGARRHLNLRPAIELHDVAYREDEPHDTRDRGQIAHGDSFHQMVAKIPHFPYHPRRSHKLELSFGEIGGL